MAFVNQMGLHFDILHESQRRDPHRLQTTGVPKSFVIESRGRDRKKVIGAAEWDAP